MTQKDQDYPERNLLFTFPSRGGAYEYSVHAEAKSVSEIVAKTLAEQLGRQACAAGDPFLPPPGLVKGLHQSWRDGYCSKPTRP